MRHILFGRPCRLRQNSTKRTLEPGSIALYRWDYKNPGGTAFNATQASSAGNQGEQGNQLASTLEVYLVESPHAGANAADLADLGNMQMARFEYSSKSCRGEGAVRDLACGEWIGVQGHPELDTHPESEREFVITEQRIVAHNNLPVDITQRVLRLFQRSGWEHVGHGELSDDKGNQVRYKTHFRCVRHGVRIVPPRPRLARPEVIGLVFTSLLLILIWQVVVNHKLLSDICFMEWNLSMDRQARFGISVFTALLLILAGGIWHSTASVAKARQLEWQQKVLELKSKEEAARATEQSRREYVLEVLGMGVTVEKYRQGKLWDVLQKGDAYTSIRETDPSKSPFYWTDKLGQSGGRALDALQNGVEKSPMFWGVPSFYAGPPMLNPAKQPSSIRPAAGLAGGAENTGMAWHLFVIGPWRLAERPDELLDEVFAFFDAHPMVPYVVVSATDGPARRHHARAPDTPSPLRDGSYIPDMPDAAAVFVLARRERVEPLRHFVWDDPDSEYLQQNLRWMYYDLMETLPTAQKLANPAAYNPDRQPTIDEWLKATEVFAKHPFVKKEEDRTSPGPLPRWKNDPPKDWQPTPWFPVPWNAEQMRAFDNLPSLGFLHRPVFVKFEDEAGKPVTTRNARHKILQADWLQALQTLKEPERGAAPARIIAAFDNQTEQRIALEEMLRHSVAQGGPAIDSDNIGQFINTDRRLGNTGAATFFIQIALGIMGSSKEGGVSAAINLRDPTTASIVLISPPRRDPAKLQAGEDNFKHKSTPLIDPENYKPPLVEDVLGTRK